MQTKEQGFTLAELLVVIVIIAILSAFSFAMVAAVQNTSRVQATQVRINALDQALSELYEKYQYRRIDVPERHPITNALLNLTSTQKAQVRLHFLHDTMRMDMPTNWEEAIEGPTQEQITGNEIFTKLPGLVKIYRDAFQRAGGAYTTPNPDYPNGPNDPDPKDTAKITTSPLPSDPNISAKLLYLILMNGNPKLRGAFSDNWVREDTDGLKYFVDSWGNPIRFLRWAPALSGSNRQPDLWKWTGSRPVSGGLPDINATTFVAELSPNNLPTKFPSLYDGIIAEYPDPLDPAMVRAGNSGWVLTPLIYSTGPDGEGGLFEVDASNPVVTDPFSVGLGAPDGTGGHFDNIHNHGLGR